MVLVGDAFDTRPFRLPWPEGTLLFCVAPAAAHAAADAALKAAGARVPRGCLLRRVPAELQAGQGCAEALERAGFRGDRLSVWALQVRRVRNAAGGGSGWGGDEGEAALQAPPSHCSRRRCDPAGAAAWRRRLPKHHLQSTAAVATIHHPQGLDCLGLDAARVTSLLTDVCDLAAFDSLVAGQLPPLERRTLDNLLASLGCAVRCARCKCCACCAALRLPAAVALAAGHPTPTRPSAARPCP